MTDDKDNEAKPMTSRKVPADFDLDQATSAVKALIQHAAKSKGDSLFMDAPVRLLMDIRAFKIPEGQNHFYNIRLPHTPHIEIADLDIVLVVPDVTDKDPDHVVGEVRDELLASTHTDKIKVREVMTLKQFRDDYKPYEAKRALVKSVDVVIADNKVWKMIPAILGREFYKKKKYPLPIPGRKFKEADIGEQIWIALHKTVLNVCLTGQNSTIVIGHDTLSEDELTENVKTVVSWLNKSFPGGWSNVQKLSLSIGQPNMPTLPIYVSTDSQNNVKTRPRTDRRKRDEPEVSEISTQLGKRVKVFSSGKIKVLKSEEPETLEGC